MADDVRSKIENGGETIEELSEGEISFGIDAMRYFDAESIYAAQITEVSQMSLMEAKIKFENDFDRIQASIQYGMDDCVAAFLKGSLDKESFKEGIETAIAFWTKAY